VGYAAARRGRALTPNGCVQVEHYFSRENLCQDAFLVSKMDAGHYVEVSVIADFKMVKQLTSDHALILESIKGSDKVVSAPCPAAGTHRAASPTPARGPACPGIYLYPLVSHVRWRGH